MNEYGQIGAVFMGFAMNNEVEVATIRQFAFSENIRRRHYGEQSAWTSGIRLRIDQYLTTGKGYDSLVSDGLNVKNSL